MSEKEYIEREAFIIAKRKQYCADCDRRKGVKRGKTVFCYEIGDAPCRSCGIGDVLDDVEDFPAADVVEVVRCKDCRYSYDDMGGLCCSHGMCVDCVVPEDFFCRYGKRKGGDGNAVDN